ncbi:hypothetical protein WA026_007120 [Henosepilachna vigintioctopunctata]|uniref:Uncharacterized protein n=1 Tax=Henosepilachna vigintioctopunctata TaxID=420089 RepID=A0AAW1V8I5_9CUCU
MKTRRRRKEQVTTSTESTPNPQWEVRIRFKESVADVKETASGLFGKFSPDLDKTNFFYTKHLSEYSSTTINWLIAEAFYIVVIVVLYRRLNRELHPEHGNVEPDMIDKTNENS